MSERTRPQQVKNVLHGSRDFWAGVLCLMISVAFTVILCQIFIWWGIIFGLLVIPCSLILVFTKFCFQIKDAWFAGQIAGFDKGIKVTDNLEQSLAKVIELRRHESPTSTGTGWPPDEAG